MAKFNISTEGNSLKIDLVVTLGDFTPSGSTFIAPSIEMVKDKFKFYEYGVYRTMLPFYEIGTIDGVVPSDIADAYAKINTLIAGIEHVLQITDYFIPLSGTIENKPVTGTILSEDGNGSSVEVKTSQIVVKYEDDSPEIDFTNVNSGNIQCSSTVGGVTTSGGISNQGLHSEDPTNGSRTNTYPLADGRLAVIGHTAPASATAAGKQGEIRVTSTFIYVCIATNTWVRSVIATW